MSISSPSDPSVRASIEDIVRDEKRLQALRRYDILDTEPEPAFDRIARLAAHLFDAPTALVNFVDADRQWFKSTVGIDAQETGLDVSFCVYTVEKGDVFVVEDLAEDERFEDNPYVTEDGIRFYAGAPLTTPDDRRLGTLCVLDTDPCSPSEETLDRLSDLAATVVDELELRRERIEHRQSRELLRHAQELAHVGGWEYTPRDDDLTWTDETYRIHGLSPDAEIDLESAVAFYAPEDRSVIRSHVETLLAEGEPYDLELDIETAEGHRRRIRTIGQAHRDDGQTTKITGAIQDITEQHRHRRLDEVQSTFFERIATGAPIHEVLDEITRFTEEELPGTAVSLLRLEDDRLYHASGSSLPDDFVEAIDGVEIGPEAGTCGAAAHRRQRTVTEDIQTDARWADYRDVAERAGLRSCSSEVIEGSDGTVLGTFALYRSAPGRPDPAERALLGRMAHVASVALERAARERALRRSEKTFRTVVENAQPVTFMIDRDGTFLLSEGSDLQALGLDPGEMVGASVYDVYANNHEVIDAVQRALGGAHVDEEVEVDGLIFDCWFSPFFDEDGTVAGVIGMAVDITDRRRAQLELRTQKEMLQTLFDNVPVMIALVDDGTIELVNEHFESVLGWSQDALESTPDLLARCYPDPHERRRMLDTIEQAPDEWRDFRPRGSEDRRVDTIWKYVVLSDGRRIGIGVDISERKARERELRENYQRLRLALEAADAGTFDHDLSTDRILWDERSLKLYGLDPDRPERDVSLLEDLLLEDDFDHLTTALDRAVDGDAPQFDTTFRVRRTDDGAVRHIRSYGIILRDEGGGGRPGHWHQPGRDRAEGAREAAAAAGGGGRTQPAHGAHHRGRSA
jgi:PAS domain S-box-containing protein